jgi:hypothetical protein
MSKNKSWETAYVIPYWWFGIPSKSKEVLRQKFILVFVCVSVWGKTMNGFIIPEAQNVRASRSADTR